jgi:hypothetical protein
MAGGSAECESVADSRFGSPCPVPKIIAWTNPLELVEKRALLRRMSPVVTQAAIRLTLSHALT